MCSTHEARLGRLGQAISEVAAAALAAADEQGSSADLAARLADVWAMVADMDPALAMRLAGYQAGQR